MGLCFPEGDLGAAVRTLEHDSFYPKETCEPKTLESAAGAIPRVVGDDTKSVALLLIRDGISGERSFVRRQDETLTETSNDSANETLTVQWGQGTGRSPSTAVVQAVSAVTEIPPRELPPLHRTIDADALNGLFSPRDQSEPDTMGVDSVSFEFEGYDVTVTAAGYVSVVPLDRRQ